MLLRGILKIDFFKKLMLSGMDKMENKIDIQREKESLKAKIGVLIETLAACKKLERVDFVIKTENRIFRYIYGINSGLSFVSSNNVKEFLETIEKSRLLPKNRRESFFNGNKKVELYIEKAGGIQEEIDEAAELFFKLAEKLIDNGHYDNVNREDEIIRRKNLSTIIENEYRYLSLLESLRECVVVSKKENDIYKIIDVNDSFMKYTGKDRTVLIGEPVHEILGVDRSFFEKINIIQEVYSGKNNKWLRGSFYGAKDGILNFIFEDITKEKEKEMTMRKLYMAIEQSEDMVVIFDKELKCEYVNNKYQKFTGYSAAEVIGVDISRLFKVIDEKNFNSVNEKIESEGYYTGEGIEIKKDGTPYWENSAITSVKNESGNIESYIKISQDITEKKSIEEKVRYAHKAIERANIAKSEFIANMSHELRTPMNGIIGAAELLKDSETTEEQSELIEMLQISSKNMLLLINSMLDISEIEFGNFAIVPRKFNIEFFLSKIVSLMENEINTYENIVFTKEINLPEIIEVEGDSRRIRQVIYILFSNALKFTEKGEIKFGVNFEDKIENIEFEFFIEDSGVGIKESEQNKIYDIFYQIDGSYTRKKGGAGVGLTIAKKITELMGGRISCKSIYGKGSRFGIKILLKKRGKIEKKKNIKMNKFYIISQDILTEIILKESIKSAGYDSEVIYLDKIENNSNIENLVLFVDIESKDEFYNLIKKIREKNRCYIIGIEDRNSYNIVKNIEESMLFDKITQKPLDKENILKIIAYIDEEFKQRGDE